jgi:hypothetical protein
MATDELTAALHACAAGLYPLEAGVALLIAEGTFLRRDDFTSRFIEHGTSNGTAMAAIGWDTVITALRAGELPCSGLPPRRRHQPRRPQHPTADHRDPTRIQETARRQRRLIIFLV